MDVKSRPQEPGGHLATGGLNGDRGTSRPSSETMGALVRRSAVRFGDRVFLPRRDSRGGEPVTFSRLAEDVRLVAAGLLARGIEHGDRIGLISENRYQWLLADLGIATIGAIDVPRGVDTAPSELDFILTHSGCRMLFAETEAVAREMHARRDNVPSIESIVTLEDSTDVEGVTTLSELMTEGAAWLTANGDELDARSAAVEPNDVLTIVYTSGTTADPKGVILTHQNILTNARVVDEVLGFGCEDRFLSVLPPWHAYERVMDYVALLVGAQLIYTDRRRIKEDLVSQQPTVFAAVPRIWESLYDGVVSRVRKLTGLRRTLMQGVLGICRRVGAGSPRIGDRLTYPILRATVLNKFRAITGGRLRIAVSGGGALPRHIDETMLGLGMPLLNGYGLTETSPVVSVRRPDDNWSGTIGTPIPEVDVEVRNEAGQALANGDTGVIWIRGPNVMQGYFRNEDRTAEVLVDGWFNSGDLGMIDSNGQIRITGRAKDTIVLAGGENVEPERVETAIKVSPLVEQAMVVGQDQKVLGALIVICEEGLEHEIPRERWGVEGDEVTGDEVVQLFRKELAKLLSRDQGFRPVEKVHAFKLILEHWTPENDMLTHTLKVKRHVVSKHYRELIEAMFDRGASE